jgi:DNA-binding response OmpR family regulator
MPPALEIFRNSRFDLVIVDQAMPQFCGEELARQIKALAPRQPIMMLTGFGDLMQGRGLKPPHVEHVVAKPITRETLLQGIATAIRQVVDNDGVTSAPELRHSCILSKEFFCKKTNCARMDDGFETQNEFPENYPVALQPLAAATAPSSSIPILHAGQTKSPDNE